MPSILSCWMCTAQFMVITKVLCHLVHQSFHFLCTPAPHVGSLTRCMINSQLPGTLEALICRCITRIFHWCLMVHYSEGISFSNLSSTPGAFLIIVPLPSKTVPSRQTWVTIPLIFRTGSLLQVWLSRASRPCVCPNSTPGEGWQWNVQPT